MWQKQQKKKKSTIQLIYFNHIVSIQREIQESDFNYSDQFFFSTTSARWLWALTGHEIPTQAKAWVAEGTSGCSDI